MKGSLGPGTLVDVVRRVREARGTGVLHIVQSADFRSVRFRGGEVVHGSSSRPEERLGAVMLRDGLVRAEDLERADDLVKKHKKRLAEALVELGALDNRGAEEALARQGREVLLAALSAQGGFYAFQEDDTPTPLERQATLRFSTEAMALAAARRLTDMGAIEFALGDLDRVLLQTEDVAARLRHTALNTLDGFVISRVDGRLSASQLIDSIGLPPEDTRRSLLCLLCAGLVRFADEGGAQAAGEATQAVAAAADGVSGQQGRTSSAEREDSDAGAPETGAALEPAQHETMLQVASAHMASARHWEAILVLQKLVPAARGLLQQKAKVMLAQAYLENPHWAHRAEALLLEVSSSESPDLDGLLVLADLYRRTSLKARAIATYRRALALSPGDARAMGALRELDPDDDAPTGPLRGLTQKD